MEWNMKTPSQWDWDNLMIFSGKVSEIPKQVHQPTDWGIEGDGGIDNGSFYSSGGGNCSGSDLGNGSSSKSSISASVDSSSKGVTKGSNFNFESVERITQDLGKRKELGRVEDGETSPILGASVGSVEPLIGLKLGKRTYFEDVCAGSTIKPSSFSTSPTSPITAAKRSRASYQSTQTPRCQVEGCNLDLSSAKDYHRRHRVCENHSKCPRVVVAGLERRFCQQCSRFHDLLEFDEKKRSCRRRLSDHNARRRKPQPEAIQFNPGRMSSSFYDARQQMSLLLNRDPLAHTRPAKPTWETSFCFKPETKESIMRSVKDGGINGQLHLPHGDLPTATMHRDSDRLLAFRGTSSEVLSQGLEAQPIAINLDTTPDFRRALSLLSINPWRSGNPESTSLDQLMHSNNPNIAQQQPWPGSSEYWQTEHHQDESSQVHSLSQINTAGQFQEFQLFKAPFESGYYSNQMS